MNYKLAIGRTLSRVDTALKKSKSKTIKNVYPWNKDFVYDLKRIFPNDINIIVDAGANVGSVSLEFSYHFPLARIIAFEPILNTFKILEKQIENNKRILPIQMALGEGQYQVEIPLNVEDTINSISSPPQEKDISGYETINVDSLDNFSEVNKIETVDILKIDVEGFEFKVLEGAEKLIQNSIKAIVLEVGYERGDNKVHFSDVENYMEGKGFQCCGVYDLAKSRDKRKLYYSNNLYIRKTLI